MENKEKNHSDAPGQNKEFAIIVNAKEKQWLDKKITFDQVIVLAFGLFENNANVSYSVAFKRGEDKKPEGTMVLGDSVTVKDKMIFNVSKTDKS
jgi:hypothetical protein